MARIYVPGDTGLATLLDDVAGKLQRRGHEIVHGPTNLPEEIKTYSAAEREAFIDGADIAVFSGRHNCTREVMQGATRLRGICYPAIGVETLDLKAANELGLIVGHGAVRGNVIGMAESTLMLMLMLLYDVETNIRLMGSGKWRRPGHHSHQMDGKTIGLIGFGRIAREVAHRLTPFGVRIITYSPRAKPESLPAGVTKVALDELLQESDVVSILTGLTPETLNMIDAAKLALMKPSAYLVNTGRGSIIDEVALHEALRDRRIAGAAIDTFAIEPLPADSSLRSLDNVIMTPHCVGHTTDGWEEFKVAMIENIERILAGELPIHCKNPEAEQAWRERLCRLGAVGQSELN